MKVLIPLAGLGTRLRPHTYTKPKPLLNVAGKPVLAHILDKLVSVPDMEEVIFIVGYLGEQIEEYVNSHYDFPTRYVEQVELQGQAHALYLAKDHLQGPVLIIFVDTIFDTDVSTLADEELDGVIYVKEVEDPRRFGVVVVEDGVIARLVEKPETPVSNLAVIGLYYLRDSCQLVSSIEELMRRDLRTKGEYFLADALQLMIDQGARFRAEPVSVWEDCGKPETLLQTNRYLLDLNGGQEVETEGSILVPPVYIDQSATIRRSVVGPHVTVGADCVVSNSILRDCIIDERARIEDVALEGTIVGSNAVVEGSFHALDIGDSSRVKLG